SKRISRLFVWRTSTFTLTQTCPPILCDLPGERHQTRKGKPISTGKDLLSFTSSSCIYPSNQSLNCTMPLINDPKTHISDIISNHLSGFLPDCCFSLQIRTQCEQIRNICADPSTVLEFSQDRLAQM